MVNKEECIITCATCMGEFDLVVASWCSCEHTGPTKVCPYCYKCFCDLAEEVQNSIWSKAPWSLLAEKERKTEERKKKKKSSQEQIFEMFELQKNAYIILVVEDDPSIQRYVKRLLESYFLSPVIVGDGDLALKYIQEHTIHLVLLDLMIPGKNGFVVCKHLKEDPQTRHIPIIITTARDNVVDKVKGFVLGVDDYITKPFQGTELIIRLLNLLRKHYL